MEEGEEASSLSTGRTTTTTAKVKTKMVETSSNLPVPMSQTCREVHPFLRKILVRIPIREGLPFAGRLNHFLENWRVLTKDKKILNVIKGWEIPLLGKPHQEKEPHPFALNPVERQVIDSEVQSMLEKGAIRETIP